MAIGTTAAILGSAVIGAGASAVAGSKNSKAINNATAAQTESNAANLALQERVYNQNRTDLNPYVQRGNQAGNAINALLGLGGSQQQGGPQAATLPGVQPNAMSQFGGPVPAGGAGAPYGLAEAPGYSYTGTNPSRAEAMAMNDMAILPNAGGLYSGIGTTSLPNVPFNPGASSPVTQTTPTTAAPAPANGQSAQQNAFDVFRNSTGYQFRLGEGLDAVNSGWAGNGLLQSGAALRGITEYGQNFASNEFGNYMSLLSGQQGTGLQAAGAQAGVGVNYANAASNINSANANALSNAAVARANNSNSTIGGIGNIFGSALGALAYQPR